MNPADLASQLFERALVEEQAVHRLEHGEDAAATRAEVRRLARERGVLIRTGMWDDIVVVIRADAQIWNDTTAVMRTKLTPTARPSRIRPRH